LLNVTVKIANKMGLQINVLSTYKMCSAHILVFFKFKHGARTASKLSAMNHDFDRLCGLVVRVPGYRSRGPGSIPGTITFFEK
jgi:hypothetical protein